MDNLSAHYSTRPLEDHTATVAGATRLPCALRRHNTPGPQAGHLYWHFALLLLGVALGIVIANGNAWITANVDRPASSKRAVSNKTKQPPLAEELPSLIDSGVGVDVDLDVRIIAVTRTSSTMQRTESGLLLPANNGLVVKLSSLLDVQSIEFEHDSIGPDDLAVAAIDAIHDLALIKATSGGSVSQSDSASQQHGRNGLSGLSILLGNAYVIETLTEKLRVEVNEKLTTFSDGSNGYPVDRRSGISDQLMPVFSTDGSGLVGLAMHEEDEPFRLKLLDRVVIESLIYDSNNLPAISISALQEDFFRSMPLGILRQFETHNATGNLEGMLEFAEQYLASGWLVKREKVIDTMNETIAQRLTELHRASNFFAAEQLFTKSSSFLPRRSGTELAYYQMQFAQSSPEDALRAAQYWIEGNTEIDKTAWLGLHYDALFSILDRPAASSENPLALLTRAIEIDSTQADYFVTRGERFALTQDYVAAIEDFEQAIRLDQGLANELNREIDKFLRRLDTPGTLRVPVTNDGGVLSTEVFINGVPFNFVVDTGASRTAISTSTMNHLRLASEAFGSVTISTANGITNGRNLTLQNVDVAGGIARNLDALVVDDLGRHDGLLGLDFLGAYQLDIDSTAGEILLTPR